MRINSILLAGIVATSLGACFPEPNNPSLNVEGEVRNAFATSLVVLRTGSHQEMLDTVSDNFTLKTQTEMLNRDAAVKHLAVDRQLIRFDKVTQDSAVLTTDDSNRQYVEVWVRTNRGWQLARVNEMDSFSRGS
jgi:hypothetical protein